MATNHKNFQDNLKKYFYSGVGLAAHTAEVLQKSMKELSKKGKVSEADGKKLINEAMKKVDARRPDIEAKYNATVHKFVTATTTEMTKLQKRIQQLEGQLKTKTTAAPKASAGATKKHTATKKRSVTKRKVAKKAIHNTATSGTSAKEPGTSSNE